MTPPLIIPKYEHGFFSSFLSGLRELVFKYKSEVARYLNLNHTTIGRYERIEGSQSRPPVGYLAALVKLIAERYEANAQAPSDLRDELLKETNRAIKAEYSWEEKPFDSWEHLEQRANLYMAKRQGEAFHRKDDKADGDSRGRLNTSVPVVITEPISISQQTALRPGSAPPVPPLIVGRKNDMKKLKKQLGLFTTEIPEYPVQVLTAIRGWPGVGKTTIASALAYDTDIVDAFPDGVLWVSLGQEPQVLSQIATWGRALGTDELLHASTIEDASALLRALLRDKRALLIIDDVWDAKHAVPFNVGGRNCATVITTRLHDVADALAPTPENIYLLPVLSNEEALELLRKLAPDVVTQYLNDVTELVNELEGLPLALQVAGRLLHREREYGLGVRELINRLKEGARLLEAKAPSDRIDIANETTPTIAALLQTSVELLDQTTQDCYAYLGVFAPKPATFDLKAMGAVWQIDNPIPFTRNLVDHGLLEFVPSLERYQMHAVLVMHAKSLLT